MRACTTRRTFYDRSMRTAIVTGRSAEHSRLRLLMEQSQTNVECTSYYDARSFIKAAKRETYQVVFLTDGIPDMDFLKLAELLHRLSLRTLIVLVGTDTGRIREAFGTNVLAYVLLERLEKEFAGVWSMIRKEISLRGTVTVQLVSRRYAQIPVDSILYVETSHRRLYMHLKGNRTVCLKPQTLRSVYPRFAKWGFVYINRNCIVNIYQIRLIESAQLQLPGRQKLPIGRKWQKRIRIQIAGA